MAEKKILEDGVVTFFSGKKEYRSLSNFWERDVILGGIIYESGEHCFHGEKYRRIGELCEDDGRKNELLENSSKFMKPSQYKTGTEVKKMGGKKGLLLSKCELTLWDSISPFVQKEICQYKHENYEEVRYDLKKSAGKILVHPALRCSEEKIKNRFWEGRAVIRDEKIVILGGNMLGNIWLEMHNNL
jgi:predicted NAD-dependent protein-ADP-ribosyltransferase YbiA (DUF1768 family)